jgi:hypothetical protein
VIKTAASKTWGSIIQFFRVFHVDAEQHVVLLTRVRLNYTQEMVLQLSHKKKEMVVPVRKKKEMVTHTLRVQLTRGKFMKNYSGGTKWRPMEMNVGWKRTPQMMRMTR